MDAMPMKHRMGIMFVIFCFIYSLFFHSFMHLPDEIPLGELFWFFAKFGILTAVAAGIFVYLDAEWPSKRTAGIMIIAWIGALITVAFVYGYACVAASFLCFFPFVFFAGVGHALGDMAHDQPLED
jgi:hypothetical protein